MSPDMVVPVQEPTRRSAGPMPNFAFDPRDPWTLTFQAGLRRAGLGGRRVYEVGVGSGVNVAYLLRHCAVELVHGSDLDPRLTGLAHRFVAESVPDLLDRFHPVEGAVNLLDPPAAAARAAGADAVVACIPQVPDPGDVLGRRFDLGAPPAATGSGRQLDDHAAHYYPWAAFNRYPFNVVGLGLIEALLRRVRSCAPHAQVILNLGCRIGKDILLQLFRSNGYRPEELASRIVRQDRRTDISFFVGLETAMRGTGYERDFTCDFYADPQARQRISAWEARQRLTNEPTRPVFHEVVVLRGHPEGPDNVDHEVTM
ncbi:hypothetical protein O7632_26875 [Solwaraspora sp. WMMD406]|uniref:hypothetical protein n=1 Tax=Solwaraspora sp. WMMD406 TaxID=3016095 RepID=UPI0024174BA1|nr:hypothetical protein [Solwaraspora sp. WMMD406]MDG4767689.1 hypothetical protein [Solwaraspora sp. WMMD406]